MVVHWIELETEELEVLDRAGQLLQCPLHTAEPRVDRGHPEGVVGVGADERRHVVVRLLDRQRPLNVGDAGDVDRAALLVLGVVGGGDGQHRRSVDPDDPVVLDEPVRVDWQPRVLQPRPVVVLDGTIDRQLAERLEVPERHRFDEPLVPGVDTGGEHVVVGVDDHRCRFLTRGGVARWRRRRARREEASPSPARCSPALPGAADSDSEVLLLCVLVAE